MVQFYDKNNFKLFRCNLDKTPMVPSWRSTEHHLTADDAQKVMDSGHYVGAWIPENYVIIDIDKGHTDREGNEKPDGETYFQDLIRETGLSLETVTNTLQVKTGSGGIHLYYKTPQGTDYRTLSQKSITTSVDVRTHLGYVIAAGTNGYSVINDVPVVEIPNALLERIQTRNKDKAKDYRPKKPLRLDLLRNILKKIPATNFPTNDSWQEFVTSTIAAAGNSEQVLDEIEEWSRTDPNYKDDTSIRKRIETFEPEGGITAGTFIHLIKTNGISNYLKNQVRLDIGHQFSYSEGFSDQYEPPFDIDYSLLSEHKELIEAFYYSRHQTAGVTLFATLVAKNLLYSTSEKSFYYFNGHRWIETEGILDIIFAVLLQAGIRFYSDHSEGRDEDADEIITSYISFVGGLALMQRFEAALKQHPTLTRSHVEWDSPDLQGTLTLRDTVLDFTQREVKFRKGKREEYRRLFIDLSEDDFSSPKNPEHFKAFLKDVFPDDETRKTATYALSTMLSGTGKFRKFQIWNGAGSNGKSTLMELMKWIIGERAISYKADVLLNKAAAQSLTPELAVFRGALVGFASETEESKRVSQGAVKALTGDETMTANPKYQKMIEFKTTFQLVLSTNYLPTFSAHDAAFIDRVLILPFYTSFYKDEEQKERARVRGSRYFKKAEDPTELLRRIKAERADILYYLVTRYQELDNTIPESEECLEAKRHYVDDNNDIVQFLTEMCEFDDTKDWFTPTRSLVDYYNDENNTRYSSKFVIMRLKEVFPLVETASKSVNGRLTRGIRHIRIKPGAFPEGAF
jgi:P4 family phage/plasmid primase-like protien